MRALVTGGAGFIGSEITKRIVERGWEAVVLDSLDPRVHPPGEPLLPDGVTLVRGDVRSNEAVSGALSGVDVVFHEAALVGLGKGDQDAGDFTGTNVDGTRLLVRAAAREAARPRVVLASSIAIYGEGSYVCGPCGSARIGARSPGDLDRGNWEPLCRECGSVLRARPVREDHPPAPGTAYARSKWEQERIALESGAGLGVEVVALRYHNVYGPMMPRDTPYAGVASMFRSRLAAGLPPLVHEDGGQLRDFIRVEDVARANVMAAIAPSGRVAGESFNVGTGAPRPVIDLARELARVLSPDIAPELSGRYRPGDARHVFASVEKARASLGFEASIPFDEGIRRFACEPLRGAPGGEAR